MTARPEFSRLERIDTIGVPPRAIHIEADEAERAALAARFALVSIGRLEADAELRREGDRIWATGRLRGEAVQSCVATGDPIRARVDEPFALRFDPADERRSEDEIELDETDLDVLTYSGGAIDLGEAVAEGFALALDPFPRVADAGARLAAVGVRSEEEAAADRAAASPFAALKALRPE